MGLFYENGLYEDALKLGSALLRELKKLDDKVLLVEVQLMESQVYYRLGNLQRSRAALTSARTTANGIYCPPRLQASLDLLSGNPEEIPTILTSKLALKYNSTHLDAMREVGIAAKNRSLGEFSAVRTKYITELSEDPVVSRHLNSFYDTLFGQNLLKLIEPYSRVQIGHIAKLIQLPLSDKLVKFYACSASSSRRDPIGRDGRCTRVALVQPQTKEDGGYDTHETVEKKLSQMILDNEHNGILDQGSGVLVLREPQCEGKDYPLALAAVLSLNGIVDMLFQKTTKLK
ncbi:hypothetical protein AHF37_10334 [Paragonimus kellicotti]|nr:hypothetical protein AHF37_10334 [Paragonimus kellicotti]